MVTSVVISAACARTTKSSSPWLSQWRTRSASRAVWSTGCSVGDQPSLVRACHDPSTRRSRSGGSISAMTATPNDPTTRVGTGRPSWGTTPRTTSTSPGSIERAWRSGEPLARDQRMAATMAAIRSVPAMSRPAPRPARGSTGARHRAAARPPSSGPSPGAMPAGSRPSGRPARVRPRPARRRAPRPRSEGSDPGAERVGELGDTSTACAAGAANPMTDPGHPCAAVGPPAGPDRTRPSTARGGGTHHPVRGSVRTACPTGTPVPLPRPPARRHPRVRVGSRLGLEVDLCASGNVGGYRARPAPGWERWRLLRCCSSRLPSRWTRRRARPGSASATVSPA